ncbi:MAG: Spy/CpxP family protein refolding chaperone [Rhodopseudomonas palustris]|uniref:Spy/CpxP family protein refolding chaperone n=1 Tax=Rhodopseudomonas palustris TaxID=1076 RepID=A0A933VZY0_RHOPL|nr:Spy/CpxP family protein refolding chaperone [Rhodopseudomonas palustris]
MDDRGKCRIVGACLLVGLSSTVLATTPAFSLERSRLAMMDDDKMSAQPDTSGAGSGSMGNMAQPSGQPQNMGPGRMPGQMPNSNMMQMMERMHGQMSGSGAMSGSNATSGPPDVTERLEGRIAFLKAELQISDKQSQDWNALADALRSSRQHLLDARKLLVMDDKTTGTERIELYERHLTERLEAIKAARAALNRLYPTLTATQKQTADTILLPLIATF